jgi:hypothetical protein
MTEQLVRACVHTTAHVNPEYFKYGKKLNGKHSNLLFMGLEMLGLQAVQKSNGVCVHAKPPSAPFSSHALRLETVLKFLRQK